MDPSSDMETKQINGQRRIRRTSGSDGGYEIFIQNLPNDLYEEELWPRLERFGEVNELRIMMNFSGLTRGFAYAKYADPKSAQEAIVNLNQREIRPGHVICVQPSLDKKKLFIGKLPTGMQTDEAVNLLTSLTPNIENIDLCTNSNRRAIVVTYKTHQDAAGARRILIPNRRQIFRDDSVIVEWASRKHQPTKHSTLKQQTWNPRPNCTANQRPQENSSSKLPKNPNHSVNRPVKFCATGTPLGRPLIRTYDQPGPLANSALFPQIRQATSFPADNVSFFGTLFY